MVYCAGKLIENLKCYFIKNNTAHFLWVYWCDIPLGKLGEHSQSLYITPSQCRSLPEAQCRAQGGSVQNLPVSRAFSS